jgi:hypothetical protein
MSIIVKYVIYDIYKIRGLIADILHNIYLVYSRLACNSFIKNIGIIYLGGPVSDLSGIYSIIKITTHVLKAQCAISCVLCRHHYIKTNSDSIYKCIVFDKAKEYRNFGTERYKIYHIACFDKLHI